MAAIQEYPDAPAIQEFPDETSAVTPAQRLAAIPPDFQKTLEAQQKAVDVGRQATSLAESQAGLGRIAEEAKEHPSGSVTLPLQIAGAPYELIDAALPHLTVEERRALAKASPGWEKTEAGAELLGKIAQFLIPVGVISKGLAEASKGARVLAPFIGAGAATQIPEAFHRAGEISASQTATPGEKLLAYGEAGIPFTLAALGLTGGGIPLRPKPRAPIEKPVSGTDITVKPALETPPEPPAPAVEEFPPEPPSKAQPPEVITPESKEVAPAITEYPPAKPEPQDLLAAPPGPVVPPGPAAEIKPVLAPELAEPIIDKIPPQPEVKKGEQNDIRPEKPSPSGMDVREPAGVGAPTVPGEKAGTTVGGQEPASPQPGGEVQAGGGDVGRRGVRGSEPVDTGPIGRPGDVGQPTDTDTVAGTGENLQEPRPESEVNHVLPHDQDWIPAGDKSKVRANLAAINLLKSLEASNRNPTPEEKAVLAQYTGWGGLKEVFDTGKASYRERPPWNEDQRKEYQNWEKSWGTLFNDVKGALTEDEWDDAARSILNAHYTSREVINGVWEGALRLGYNGGNALEPAVGIGHFIGLEPESTRGKSKWRALDLDSTSARIAKKLYPQASVQNTGYEDAKVANNSQDLVISNFPFAASGPQDKRYPNFSLHNYFFARSLDAVKPGGLIVAITSDSTMDSNASRQAREYMAERADLVGAIRLPNTAFKKNAGTEVTTDILFFRKRGGVPFNGAQDFVRTVPSETYDGKPIEINEYYVNNPEMMLGRMSLEGTMYGPDQQALLPNPGKPLSEQLSEAVQKLPANVFGAEKSVAESASRTEMADKGSKVGGLVVKDGVPYRVEGDGTMTKPEWAGNATKVKQAVRYVQMRDAASSAIAAMYNPNSSDDDVAANRKVLNQLYDDYVKRYGAFGERASAFLDDDVDFPLVLSLEDANTKIVETPKGAKKVTEYSKSDIFRKRTLFPRVPPAKVDTVPDALQVSMNFGGKVDPDYIAKLTGRTSDEVKNELLQTGAAFENPRTGHWETRSEYLSGFVKEKLHDAEKALADDSRMAKNVEELKKVQPAPIAIENIGFRLGSRWIPEDVIKQFIAEMLGVRAHVSLTEQTGDWHVIAQAGQYDERNKTLYGIHGWSGHELVESALNLKSPKVTMTVSDGKGGTTEVKDGPKTLEAEAKQAQLQQEFKKFVLSHPDLAREMEQVYNERHNGVVIQKFEPPTWAHYPGASTDITLREHQKAVVARMLQNSTLLAHSVGTGKTYAMITAAMEMRRLGLAKKPMIVVQNATLEQFARSFKRLYPAARVLAPNARSRDALNRNKTMSRIATGDWDAVIIPQSFMNMLPDDPVREENWIKDQIRQLEADKISAAHTSGKRSPKASDLQRAIKKLEERLDSLADRKKDNVLTFEQLGVDALFVDEAHAYKKLQFNTKMENIKGLDTGASQRGLSMMFKARWVQEKNQGRNVIFATGTPVSNTIAEAWTMMRYLRPDVLKKYHIEDFDSFAGTFGDTITQLEMGAAGTWKGVTRFAKYSNGPELIAAWRTVADVVTPEEVNLPGLPALKNKAETTLTIKQSPALAGYIQHLRQRLEEFAQMSGKEKRENSHIPLVVFGLAKKASLDMRMIDPSLADEPDSKLNVAADNIYRIYKESEPEKGTQMVFSDSYQDNPEAPKFNLYDELKRKLVERGIPANEIVIMTPDIKDAKREAIFEKFNQGEVRVAIGSTERMGVGVNAQEKMIALHHLDAPPRPMDIEQRNGRILRQGNTNPVVEILKYGVENTLDAAMYQKLATKQKFINQILRGDITGRNFEDAANEQSLTFEEQMAAFSGDKRAMEKVALENNVRRLQSLRSGHYNQVRNARDTIADLENRQIPYSHDQIKAADKRAADYAVAFPPDFEPKIQIGNKTFVGTKEAWAGLDNLFKFEISNADKQAKEKSHFGSVIGQWHKGFTVNGKPVMVRPVLQSDDKGLRNLERATVGWRFEDSGLEHEVKSGQGFFASLKADLESIAKEPERVRGNLQAQQRNLAELSGFIKQPFGQEEELKTTEKKLTVLTAELEAEGKAQEEEARKRAAAKPPDEPPPETPPGIISMGGKAPSDPGEIPQTSLGSLIDALPSSDPNQRPSLGKAFSIGERLSPLKDRATEAIYGLRAVGKSLAKRLEGFPEFTKFMQLIGDRHLALTESALNVRKFVKEASKAFPSKLTQEAITDWVDTGGDEELLKQAAEQTKPRYKAGYEKALSLSDDEKTYARNIQNYFEARLQEAIDAGVLEDGVEDFIHRFYEKDSAWKRQILAELRSGIFTGRPALAKKRVFQYDFEAEQAGYRPEKSFIKRVAAYDLSLNKAIADRALVKGLMNLKTSDGSPWISVAGAASKVSGGGSDALLIKPGVKPKSASDYSYFDHPALRKWKWVAADDSGNNVFVQGDVLIHQEALPKVKSLFERSWLRQKPGFRMMLNLGSTTKQTMFDLSGFHYVQIGIHAAEHQRLQTFSKFGGIDLTNSDQRGLVRGGMVIGETSGREHFDEGLAGSSLTRHIPFGIGERIQAAKNHLFTDFIPFLKMKTGLMALERNRELFPNLTDDEVYHLTANQMNAAFGELNYAMLGRSATAQDVIRLVGMSPDFTEARIRFGGQAMTKYGGRPHFDEKGGFKIGEQGKALLSGMLAFYILARILNKLISGNYHMEIRNAFSVVINGRAYGLRTVQGDILHAATDPESFIRYRLNPLYGRAGMEVITGRDEFGRKRTFPQQVEDIAKTPVPISVRGLISGKEQDLSESLFNSMGITEKRDAEDADEKKKKAKPPFKPLKLR